MCATMCGPARCNMARRASVTAHVSAPIPLRRFHIDDFFRYMRRRNTGLRRWPPRQAATDVSCSQDRATRSGARNPGTVQSKCEAPAFARVPHQQCACDNTTLDRSSSPQRSRMASLSRHSREIRNRRPAWRISPGSENGLRQQGRGARGTRRTAESVGAGRKAVRP